MAQLDPSTQLKEYLTSQSGVITPTTPASKLDNKLNSVQKALQDKTVNVSNTLPNKALSLVSNREGMLTTPHVGGFNFAENFRLREEEFQGTRNVERELNLPANSLTPEAAREIILGFNRDVNLAQEKNATTPQEMDGSFGFESELFKQHVIEANPKAKRQQEYQESLAEVPNNRSWLANTALGVAKTADQITAGGGKLLESLIRNDTSLGEIAGTAVKGVAGLTDSLLNYANSKAIPSAQETTINNPFKLVGEAFRLYSQTRRLQKQENNPSRTDFGNAVADFIDGVDQALGTVSSAGNSNLSLLIAKNYDPTAVNKVTESVRKDMEEVKDIVDFAKVIAANIVEHPMTAIQMFVEQAPNFILASSGVGAGLLIGSIYANSTDEIALDFIQNNGRAPTSKEAEFINTTALAGAIAEVAGDRVISNMLSGRLTSLAKNNPVLTQVLAAPSVTIKAISTETVAEGLGSLSRAQGLNQDYSIENMSRDQKLDILTDAAIGGFAASPAGVGSIPKSVVGVGQSAVKGYESIPNSVKDSVKQNVDKVSSYFSKAERDTIRSNIPVEEVDFETTTKSGTEIKIDKNYNPDSLIQKTTSEIKKTLMDYSNLEKVEPANVEEFSSKLTTLQEELDLHLNNFAKQEAVLKSKLEAEPSVELKSIAEKAEKSLVQFSKNVENVKEIVGDVVLEALDQIDSKDLELNPSLAARKAALENTLLGSIPGLKEADLLKAETIATETSNKEMLGLIEKRKEAIQLIKDMQEHIQKLSNVSKQGKSTQEVSRDYLEGNISTGQLGVKQYLSLAGQYYKENNTKGLDFLLNKLDRWINKDLEVKAPSVRAARAKDKAFLSKTKAIIESMVQELGGETVVQPISEATEPLSSKEPVIDQLVEKSPVETVIETPKKEGIPDVNNQQTIIKTEQVKQTPVDLNKKTKPVDLNKKTKPVDLSKQAKPVDLSKQANVIKTKENERQNTFEGYALDGIYSVESFIDGYTSPDQPQQNILKMLETSKNNITKEQLLFIKNNKQALKEFKEYVGQLNKPAFETKPVALSKQTKNVVSAKLNKWRSIFKPTKDYSLRFFKIEGKPLVKIDNQILTLILDSNEISNNEYIWKDKELFLNTTTKLYTKDLHGSKEAFQIAEKRTFEIVNDFISTMELQIEGNIPNKGQLNKGKVSSFEDAPLALLMTADLNGKNVLSANIKSIVAIEAMQALYDMTNDSLFRDAESITALLGGTKDLAPRLPLNLFKKYTRIGSLESVVAHSIGSKILNNIKLNLNPETTPETLRDSLKTAFGLYALAYLKKKGFVEKTAINTVEFSKDQAQAGISNKEQIIEPKAMTNFIQVAMVDTEVSPSVKNQVEFISKSKDFNKSVFDVSNTTIRPTTKKPKNTTNTENEKSKSKIPENIKKRMDEYAEVPYTFNTKFMEMLVSENGLNKALKILGLDTFESDLAKAHFSTREGLKTNYQATKRALNFLIEEYLEHKDAPLYFTHELKVQLRNHINANSINPQTDKLQRLLFQPIDNQVLVDSNLIADPLKRENLLTAIAVGFGFDEKGSLEQRESVLRKAKNLHRELVAEEALSMLLDTPLELLTDFQLEDLLGYLKEFGVSGFEGINALLELHQFETIEVNPNKSYTSTAVIEVDGVTNGFALGLLQFPILENIEMWLNRVGVYTTENFKNFNDFITRKENTDSYQSIAKPLVEWLSLEDMKEVKDFAFFIFGSLVDEKNNVTKIARNIIKSPFMIFNYGAGDKKIVLDIQNGIVEAFYNKIEKIESQKKEYFSKNRPKELGIEIADQIKTLEKLTGLPLKGKNLLGVDFKNVLDKKINRLPMKKVNPDDLGGLGYALAKIVATAISESIGDLDIVKNAVNDAYMAQFALFELKYEETLNRLGVHDTEALTVSQAEQLIQTLTPYLPRFYAPSVYEKGERKGTDSDFIGVFDYEKTRGGVSVNISLKSTESSTSTITTQKFINGGVSGLVKNIHAMDADIISKVRQKVLRVHDAVKTGSNNFIEASKELNNAVADLIENYDLIHAVLVRQSEMMELLDKEPNINAEAVNKRMTLIKQKIIPNILKEGNEAKLPKIELINQELFNIFQLTNKAKNDLFNNKTIVIDQYPTPLSLGAVTRLIKLPKLSVPDSFKKHINISTVEVNAVDNSVNNYNNTAPSFGLETTQEGTLDIDLTSFKELMDGLSSNLKTEVLRIMRTELDNPKYKNSRSQTILNQIIEGCK